ncbi:MAG: hypothetical protein ACOYK6_02325, partial [Chthoniobacterales bacterium]
MISSASTSTFNFNCCEASSGAAGLAFWFQELQAAAWKKFSDLPLPSRHDEMWRFSDLKKTSLETFHVASAPVDQEVIVRRSQGMSEVAATLIFANDQLIHRDVAA